MDRCLKTEDSLSSSYEGSSPAILVLKPLLEASHPLVPGSNTTGGVAGSPRQMRERQIGARTACSALKAHSSNWAAGRRCRRGEPGPCLQPVKGRCHGGNCLVRRPRRLGASVRPLGGDQGKFPLLKTHRRAARRSLCACCN